MNQLLMTLYKCHKFVIPVFLCILLDFYMYHGLKEKNTVKPALVTTSIMQ